MALQHTDTGSSLKKVTPNQQRPKEEENYLFAALSKRFNAMNLADDDVEDLESDDEGFEDDHDSSLSSDDDNLLEL